MAEAGEPHHFSLLNPKEKLDESEHEPTSSTLPKQTQEFQTIHTGEKELKCNFCGKIFTRQSILDRHTRTHTKEKPFKCPTCGKLFSDNSNLRGHLKVHLSGNYFRCTLCEKSFRTESGLRFHEMYYLHTI